MVSNRTWRRIGAACALVLLAALVVPGRAQALTLPVPTEIDPTGTLEVSGALNEFLAGVPDGATVVFPEGATYSVENVIALEGRHDLTLDFRGSRLVTNTDGTTEEPFHPLRAHWPRHRTHLWIAGSSGIHVQDLVVRGPNVLGGTDVGAYRPEFEAQHAVEVAGSTDVSIEGCDVSQIYGDGVYVGHSERVEVRGCSIHHNGRQGIAVTSGRDVVIEHNHIYEIRRTALDLEPNGFGAEIENVVIRKNLVGFARGNFVSGHGRGSTFTGISIVENHVYGEMQVNLKAPADTLRGSVEIRDNRSPKKFGSPQALLSVVRYGDVTIVGNSAPLDGRSGGVAVSVLEGCEVDIEDNAFTNVETHQVVTPASECPPGVDPPTQVTDVRIGPADLVEP
jgi:hypothetical protein